MMRKNWLFFGLAVVLTGLLTFLFRLIDSPFFAKSLNLLIVFGAIGLLAVIVGMFKRMNKVWMASGLGILGTAIVTFLLRLIGLEDNLIVFILLLVVGLTTMIVGLVKR